MISSITSNPEISSTIIGAFLGFLFAVLSNFLWQFYLDRKNKVQLTYQKKIEAHLTIAKE